MKKYFCFTIALFAIYAASFTEVFDNSLVLAVGGLDKCNGLDIAGGLNCPQNVASHATCSPSAKYQIVEDIQAYKDVHYTPTTVCDSSGCDNIPNNPTPSGRGCEKYTKNPLDPIDVGA